MAMASMEQQYWEEEEEAVEVGFKRRHESLRQEMGETAATAIVDGKVEAKTFTEGTESTFFIWEITNTIPQLISNPEILTELPIPQPPLKTSSPEPDIHVNSSHINGTESNGSIPTMQEGRHHYTDVYLEPTFQKQPTQEFFCPNCNTCIRKVVLRNSDWQFVSSPHVTPEHPVIPCLPEPFRCTSCFSFLVPIGSWFNTLIRPEKEDHKEEDERDPLLLNPGRGTSTTKIPEVENGKDAKKEPPSGKFDDQGSEIEDDRGDEARPNEESPQLEVLIHGETPVEKKSGSLSPIIEIPSKAKEKEESKKSGKGPVEGEPPIGASTDAGSSVRTGAETSADTGGRDSLEILKSIVYGGLAESITSLSVVTSAAGASVSSSKIVAMALANLIGGLFVIIHNIWDLKAEQARTVSNENEEVDRYQKLLGKRENFALHATLVLLSFLVFGLEPPLVYSFSFRNSDNIDYKIAVVAGASFLCISLLALAKAHIQEPSNCHGYLKTLVYYLVIGFAASGISYVAGDLIGKLLDKLGLFNSGSEAAFFLPFNDVSAVNPTWSSF